MVWVLSSLSPFGGLPLLPLPLGTSPPPSSLSSKPWRNGRAEGGRSVVAGDGHEREEKSRRRLGRRRLQKLSEDEGRGREAPNGCVVQREREQRSERASSDGGRRPLSPPPLDSACV